MKLRDLEVEEAPAAEYNALQSPMKNEREPDTMLDGELEGNSQLVMMWADGSVALLESPERCMGKEACVRTLEPQILGCCCMRSHSSLKTVGTR